MLKFNEEEYLKGGAYTMSLLDRMKDVAVQIP